MLKLVNWLLGFVLIFLSTAPPVWAQSGWQPVQEAIHKSSEDPRHYQAIRLNNGMTVLLLSDKEAVKSLAAVVVPVGSLENLHNQRGLAHYLEHMILMGSRHYPELENLSEFLKKHGVDHGDHNVSTVFYRTAFYLEVGNDALQPAIDRLADAIAAPLLDPVYADKERHAVDAELRMARASDGLCMAQIRSETMHPAHPGSRFLGGNLDTLSDKPNSKLHDALQHFYKRYYSANLMVAVIYSNQQLPNMAKLTAATFSHIANHWASVPPITVPAVTAAQTGIVIYYQPVQPRKMLRIEFPIANNSAAFRSKTDNYIRYLIGNRSPGTMANWLQKEGLAYAIDAGTDPMINRNGWVFAIAASLSNKGYAQRDLVVAAIFAYLLLLRHQGIQHHYFDKIVHVLDQGFRFPVMIRNMDYIEWLVDSMRLVPVQHVLDASYLAYRYNPAAISARLDAMKPQYARVWFISPDAPHDKIFYFVDAPYQVSKMMPVQIARWRHQQRAITLLLPTLNPYIANDFSLIRSANHTEHPETLIDEPGLRLHYMSSRAFAYALCADITLNFRNAAAMGSARNQVLYSLNDYLSNLELVELSNQAYVVGISFPSYVNNGLTIKASGYTQRLVPLVNALLDRYLAIAPTVQQLQQAETWCRQQLDGTDKSKAYSQVIIPAKVLYDVPCVEHDAQRALINGITLQEVMDYRATFIKPTAWDVLVVGNLLPERAKTLAHVLKECLGLTGIYWWRADKATVDAPLRALIQKRLDSTDSALVAVYVPLGYDRIKGMSCSYLLSQIVESWFYKQLRTQEQLGYAVFMLPIFVGDQAGVGFLLQSGHYQQAYLYQRYLVFFTQAGQRLNTLDPTDFEQYKQGVIAQLQQKSQTLGEEVDLYTGDLDRNNMRFDTRARLIARLRTLTQPQLSDYFQRAVIKQQGLAMLSQISGVGAGNDPADYAYPTGWALFSDASALHQARPVQSKEADRADDRREP